MPPQQVFSSLPTAPSSFPQFGLLPVELRIKIWDDVQQLNHNRIVNIAYSPRIKSFISTTKPPATLYATQESRFLALRVYTLFFATLECKTPKIYFSPSTDILSFNWSIFRRNIENLQTRELGTVQSVQIKHSELLRHVRSQLGRFRALKKVFVDCDGELEFGKRFGRIGGISELVRRMKAGQGVELVCSRGAHASGLRCSRHWWFHEWNLRVSGKEEEEEEGKEKNEMDWELVLRRCMDAVERDERRACESRRVIPLGEEYAAVWQDVSDIMRFH